MKIRLLLTFAFCFFFAPALQVVGAIDPFPIVLVDKGSNNIHEAQYTSGEIKILKTYHATLGKAVGDKIVENDFKTPEGIYFFTAKLEPPQIKKKFGRMALYMNYPNPVDQKQGKTGYDIMLHATDEPQRLQKNHDSEGCIVISDDQILEMSKSVRLGLTPIIVYPELKPEYLNENGNPEVKNAFTTWLTAWEGKDLDTYIGSYSPDFIYDGMNLNNYRNHKKGLNERYAKINVNVQNLRFFHHPKYSVVTFTQNYSSTLKSGRLGFSGRGTKALYFVRTASGYKISSETYTSVLEL